jgi:hypothetical protein
MAFMKVRVIAGKKKFELLIHTVSRIFCFDVCFISD